MHALSPLPSTLVELLVHPVQQPQQELLGIDFDTVAMTKSLTQRKFARVWSALVDVAVDPTEKTSRRFRAALAQRRRAQR